MNLSILTRNIVLTEHQSSLVDDSVSSGRYQNASKVLREPIQVGIDDIEAGRPKTFDSSESLKAHFKTLAAK